MLHEPERHETLQVVPWNEAEARAAIETIVRDCERRLDGERYWPWHPQDLEPGDDVSQPAMPMYHGAAGVVWAIRHLQAIGAATSARSYREQLADLLERTRNASSDAAASYIMGETPILMMLHEHEPRPEHADRLAALIERNVDHPARELMWGSPGTMLAASCLHARTGEARWAALFRRTADHLWAQLELSDALDCGYWTQTLYGRRTTYLDAIHGFVGTAFVIIQGRRLLDADRWRGWQRTIVDTVVRTATREAGKANWRTQLTTRAEAPRLMQFCHGAPGFVICLAKFPGAELDELLLEAGEAIWAAGPLKKGANLCHGTAGNGYAFLELYERTGDSVWLERARAFAMHAIAQSRADVRQFGQLRYSLWTGDPGLAIYLADCIRARAAFPTLEVF